MWKKFVSCRLKPTGRVSFCVCVYGGRGRYVCGSSQSLGVFLDHSAHLIQGSLGL